MKKFLSMMAVWAMFLGFAACGPINQGGGGQEEPDQPGEEEVNNSGLNIEISNLRWDGCDFTITPNDKKKFYYAEIATKDTLKKYPDLDVMAAKHIAAMYKMYDYYVSLGAISSEITFAEAAELSQGKQDMQVGMLEAETEYAIIAYYIDVEGETPALDGTVGKKSFTTVKYVDEAAFKFESRDATTENFTFTSIEVQKDADNDVAYFDLQTNADAEGMFYECVVYILNGELAAGTYEVTDSEEANTAIASPGAAQGDDGNYYVQPSIVGHTNGQEMDQVWFLRGGSVKIEYPKADYIKITGVVTTFYGTKIAIMYNGPYEDPAKDTVQAPALMPKVGKMNTVKTFKF